MRPVIIFFLFTFLTLQQVSGQDGFTGQSPALAYWTVGEGREVVIVLHGGPGAGHQYLRPEWDQLSKVAKVVYYDQRGCGRSEKVECYSWREQVNDLKRVIERVANDRKVVLAGSSWGSTLALLYAYYHPGDVRALILSGTTEWKGKGEPPKQCEAYMLQFFTSSGSDKGGKLASLLDSMTTSLSASFHLSTRDTFRLLPLPYEPALAVEKEKYFEAHTSLFTSAVSSLVEAPALQSLSALTLPVLIFKGSGNCMQTAAKDRADQYQAVFPNACVYEIKEACHDPWLTHTEEFFRVAFTFIEQAK